jgi:hypothetical protein
MLPAVRLDDPSWMRWLQFDDDAIVVVMTGHNRSEQEARIEQLAEAEKNLRPPNAS